jgi:hypothetical protein
MIIDERPRIISQRFIKLSSQKPCLLIYIFNYIRAYVPPPPRTRMGKMVLLPPPSIYMVLLSSNANLSRIT